MRRSLLEYFLDGLPRVLPVVGDDDIQQPAMTLQEIVVGQAKQGLGIPGHVVEGNVPVVGITRAQHDAREALIGIDQLLLGCQRACLRLAQVTDVHQRSKQPRAHPFATGKLV